MSGEWREKLGKLHTRWIYFQKTKKIKLDIFDWNLQQNHFRCWRFQLYRNLMRRKNFNLVNSYVYTLRNITKWKWNFVKSKRDVLQYFKSFFMLNVDIILIYTIWKGFVEISVWNYLVLCKGSRLMWTLANFFLRPPDISSHNDFRYKWNLCILKHFCLRNFIKKYPFSRRDQYKYWHP